MRYRMFPGPVCISNVKRGLGRRQPGKHYMIRCGAKQWPETKHNQNGIVSKTLQSRSPHFQFSEKGKYCETTISPGLLKMPIKTGAVQSTRSLQLRPVLSPLYDQGEC